MYSSLKDLYYSKDRSDSWNQDYTDKGNIHTYIEDYYDKEFTPRKGMYVNILEIGIYRGGSLRLWLDWFHNVSLWGMDINKDYFLGEINDMRCKILFEDAYKKETSMEFDNDFFDYIIDDGPHTTESHLQAIKIWTPKLKKGGKLVIEDVNNIFSFPVLEKTCKDMKLSYNIFDKREGRLHDNIIFEVIK